MGSRGFVLNIALRFAYDGHAFPNGYARQPQGGTVEDALIEAARGAGYIDGSWAPGSRTDKGVSAADNVAKLALDRPHLKGLVPALQANLPAGVWVLGATEVDDAWNPRFHAVRTYQYVAPNHGEDAALLAEACQAFVGTHNMTGFARVESHRDPMRTVDRFDVEAGENDWTFTVASEGFLWNQVRRMVDAALLVARGGAAVADIEGSLASGQPDDRFGLAPAEGLLLRSVRYTPELQWDASAGTLDVRRLEPLHQQLATETALLRALSESS